MSSKNKTSRMIIYVLEIAIVYGISSFGRTLFDQAAASLSPAWLVTALKLLLFVVIIILAIIGDAQLERFLKSRGLSE